MPDSAVWFTPDPLRALQHTRAKRDAILSQNVELGACPRMRNSERNELNTEKSVAKKIMDI